MASESKPQSKNDKAGADSTFDEERKMIEEQEQTITQASSPPRIRAANLFCGDGSLAAMAKGIGIEVVYAHDTLKKNRLAFEKKVGLVVDDRGLNVHFDEVPRFNFLLATLPEGKQDLAMQLATQFLRARMPGTFVLVGRRRDNDEEYAAWMRRQTEGLPYGIVSGGQMLRGIKRSSDFDACVVVGALCLASEDVPDLISRERVRGQSVSTVRLLLERLVSGGRI